MPTTREAGGQRQGGKIWDSSTGREKAAVRPRQPAPRHQRRSAAGWRLRVAGRGPGRRDLGPQLGKRVAKSAAHTRGPLAPPPAAQDSCLRRGRKPPVPLTPPAGLRKRGRRSAPPAPGPPADPPADPPAAAAAASASASAWAVTPGVRGVRGAAGAGRARATFPERPGRPCLRCCSSQFREF
jgi:hypothetical protein